MNNEKLALIIRKPRMDLTISYVLELNKKTNLILEILTNVQEFYQLTTKPIHVHKLPGQEINVSTKIESNKTRNE